jgi:iron complex outermembrane receptor protein
MPPFGFPQTDYPSPTLLWQYYEENPLRFTTDPVRTYENSLDGSRHTDELISAAYLRADLSFLENRLKVVGGARVEQTNIKAEGALSDETLNYQRDANGQIVREANGDPLTLLPQSDELGISQLTFIERGARVERDYVTVLPSINASFNLLDNLILRAALYQSIGRPDNSQYTGGINLPNTDNPPSGGNSIRVNNAGIEPWSANSAVVRLEYYFQKLGLFTMGAFRRNLTNAFGGTTVEATPEFLDRYNLDPATYGIYDVRTNENYSLFASLRNVTAKSGDTEIYGPETAPIARLRQTEPHPSIWIFGIKGTF